MSLSSPSASFTTAKKIQTISQSSTPFLIPIPCKPIPFLSKVQLEKMYATTAFLVSSIFASTILAAPGAILSTRTCSTAYPEVARVSEAQPDATSLTGFTISQDAGATNKQDVFIEFAVPAGSYGCQLEVQFPPNYPIQASGQTQVYVYSTDANLPRNSQGSIDVSWNTSPATVSQVATVIFEQNPTTKKVLNSFVCKPKLTFRLSISRDQTGAGFVSFVQSAAAGLRLTYNC